MPMRPCLVTWLDGLPTIETVAPLLARIQARGSVKVRILLPEKKFPPNGVVARRLQSLGLTYVGVSRLRSKLLFQQDLKDSDAFLVLTDPAFDTSSRRFRSWMIRNSGKPVIFVQHGAFQAGVNAPFGRAMPSPLHYHSDTLLLWDCAEPENAILSAESLYKVHVCGFIKQPFFPLNELSPDLQSWKEQHTHRVLICQSFRWSSDRFDQIAIQSWYDTLDTFLSRNPDIGVLLRPHRGKAHRNHRKLDTALMARHGNLLVSNEKEGLLQNASINDCISLCQSVICPESTVVLDALYMQRHVMIWDSQQLIFSELPRVTVMDDILSFARDPAPLWQASAAVRSRYGNVDENLDRAAQHIVEVLVAKGGQRITTQNALR